MRSIHLILPLLLVVASLVGADPVPLTLSRLFTEGAVLQRGQAVPVWGTAAPGTKVTVTFADQRVSTVGGPDGAWRVDLAPMVASSEGRDLVVETSDGQGRTLADIVVGDVWFCAGQSNMELGMAAIADRPKELKDLKHPDLRLYLIPKSASGRPRTEVIGVWSHSTRESVTTGGWRGFSAVAYTFGRKLQVELGVPVGVIQAAYGGSPIDAWIPREDLLADPLYARYARKIQQADQAYLKDLKTDPQARHPFDDPTETSQLGPSAIFNALMAPLGPLAIKGALWYQGETDVGDGPLYTAKMNTMIAAWRRTFGQPKLPFYFVQIAPWQGYGPESLPILWAAQEEVLKTPGTGMALTVDVGDFGDIHPANKRPVGERLAYQALVKTYGRIDIVADGPVLASWKALPTGTEVSFESATDLKTADGAVPLGFEVLDATGTWRPAGATLAGKTVVLATSISVEGVRYAWVSTPKVNLTDANGLPARPFESVK